MAVRNVIFDFGGVLVRWKPQEIIARFYDDESLRSIVTRGVLQHPDWLEMDRGTFDGDAAVARFAEHTGRPAQEISAFLEHVRDSLTPVPEMVALVRELAGRGIPLYGLSNMATSTFAHLRARDDFWDAFKGIVISGHIRMIKPDREIFEYIAREHSLVPAQTVFIDDHAPNIDAARALGFRTILFSTPQECSASLERMLEGR